MNSQLKEETLGCTVSGTLLDTPILFRFISEKLKTLWYFICLANGFQSTQIPLASEILWDRTTWEGEEKRVWETHPPQFPHSTTDPRERIRVSDGSQNPTMSVKDRGREVLPEPATRMTLEENSLRTNEQAGPLFVRGADQLMGEMET